MFQIICKIGPIDVLTYGKFIAALTAVSGLTIFIMSLLHAKRGSVLAFLFWVAVLAVLAMAPLLTTVTIYSYGLMVAIAVVVCTALLVRDAQQYKIQTDVVFDLVFWVIVGGVIGARLFYVLLNYSFFSQYPHEIFMIQNGGLAWQGGLIFGLLTAIIFIKTKKMFLPAVADLSAPYLALGQAIGRIGCFLNGCCFGRAVEGGVYFPVHDAYLHPTQLYLSGGLLMIFFILKNYQKNSQIPGLVFSSYLILASSLRFIVEFFRADHEIFFLGLSIYQFVCMGIFAFAFLFAYVMLFKYSKPDDSL